MDRWSRRTLVLVAFVIVGLLLVAPGCGKKPKPAADVTEEPTSTTEQPIVDQDTPAEQPDQPARDLRGDRGALDLVRVPAG